MIRTNKFGTQFLKICYRDIHEVMQSATEVLPFRQRQQGATNTVCYATLTYGYENTVFQTKKQASWLKAKIFITAGKAIAVACGYEYRITYLPKRQD